MGRHKKHLLVDILIIALSVLLAFILAYSGALHAFIVWLKGMSWIGVLLGGSLFTTAFTTAPAIALLGELAETNSLILLTFLGGLGAAVGDFFIFLFVRDRVSDDISYVLSHSRGKRFLHLFKARLFRYFIPFLGGIIIASPLPDELGVSLLGIAHVKSRYFLLVSFIFNSLGIFLIGMAARALAN